MSVELAVHPEAQEGPDFIGIGAQKSATSFIHKLLERHPNVAFPATRERLNAPPIDLDGRLVVTWPKEIQFLHGENSDMSWEDYLGVFRDNPPGKVYGEISPAYLVAPQERIRELRERAPHVRLFAILRDPVERDWSAVRMIAKRQRKLDDHDVLMSISTWDQIRSYGDYATGLRNWLEVFPRDQLLVLPFELLQTDRERMLRTLCAHLGVDAEPILNVDQERVFTGPEAPLPDDIRAGLTERYAGVIGRLKDVCGVDFSEYWSSGLT